MTAQKQLPLSGFGFSGFIDLLLARLYDIERQQEQGKFWSLNSIASQMKEKIPTIWVLDAARIMESRGLVTAIYTFGGNVRAELSGDGRMYVEENRGTGVIAEYKKHPSRFFAAKPQTGRSGSARPLERKATLAEERKPLFDVIGKMKHGLRQDKSLSAESRSDALRDLATIEEQLKKREPNRSAIAALLEPLSRIGSIADHIANVITLINP
jgi:hypothetical protein